MAVERNRPEHNGRIRMRLAGAPGPRGGGVYVTALQRGRVLDATFAVVAEQGYDRFTVRKVCGRAGVSSKTFYDLFSDREDCFLAAFDVAVGELGDIALPAYKPERDWVAGIRAGLAAVLGFLDREPELCGLVFVQALGAGPRVLARRAGVLGQLERVVDEGRGGMKAGQRLSALTAEGVVGGVFGVIYARFQERRAEPLIGLLGELMAIVVLPYRGHGAAARELSRLPDFAVSQAGPRLSPADRSRFSGPAGGTSGIPRRLTVRTQMALAAVAELGANGSQPSSREVADAAGIGDQGQISRLLARLEALGLVQDSSRAVRGVRKAWWITPRGETVLRAGERYGRRTDASGFAR